MILDIYEVLAHYLGHSITLEYYVRVLC